MTNTENPIRFILMMNLKKNAKHARHETEQEKFKFTTFYKSFMKIWSYELWEPGSH